MLYALSLCKLAQKYVPVFLLYTAIVCFTAHRFIKLLRDKTKYFYSRKKHHLFYLLHQADFPASPEIPRVSWSPKAYYSKTIIIF